MLRRSRLFALGGQPWPRNTLLVRHVRGGVATARTLGVVGRSVARRRAGEPFQGAGHPAQGRPEIREIYEREHKACDPEDMLVREKGQQPKYGHNLELQLVRPVRHAFGQRMQAQEKNAHPQHREDQKDGHHHHPGIRLPRGRDECRQIVACGRIHLSRHVASIEGTPVRDPLAPFPMPSGVIGIYSTGALFPTLTSTSVVSKPDRPSVRRREQEIRWHIELYQFPRVVPSGSSPASGTSQS